MQQDSLTLYKLIILFLLNKVDFPLSNAQISDFILEKEYTDYFNIQQAISELCDADFVVTETFRNSSSLHITDAGKEVLGFCENDISDGIKSDIMDYLSKNNYSLRDESSTVAQFYQAQVDEFVARCIVREKNNNLIELNLSVTSETEAETICKNWKKNSQEIYAYLIETLLVD